LGGNRFNYYEMKMDLNAAQDFSLENYLRHAIEYNELEIYYQPQISCKSNRVVGSEALLRWNHPQLGLLTPDRFIDMAEQTGIEENLSEWILKTACTDTCAWQKAGFPNLTVAVNLSTRQFLQSGLEQVVQRILTESGLDAEFLEMEITESIAVEDVENTCELMHRLRNLGITLSLDDFGTGYSSLSYLNQFPIEKIKLDQTFVKDLDNNRHNAAICRSVITLAHSLNLRVIAEGIETPSQQQFLEKENCDLLQGYLISKPLPANEFSTFLQNYTTAVSEI